MKPQGYEPNNDDYDEPQIYENHKYEPYPLDEFVHEDDPSRQHQTNFDILYYVILYGRSLFELSQKNHVPEVIAPNEPDIPHTEDRWSRDQHIDLVNIIVDLSEGMLTKSMAAKLTAASASECLFADFFSKIEPKKVSKALKHPGWIDAMQE
nr:hypothetical protein [Tanacetum cinerariifolium]